MLPPVSLPQVPKAILRCLSAVTIARFAAFHGLLVVPVPLSTMPAPLRKSRARHERASAMCRHERRASVCGSAAGRSAPAAIR